jgi:hypothetical protein
LFVESASTPFTAHVLRLLIATECLQPHALTNAMCLVTISHWAIDAAYNLAEMDFVSSMAISGRATSSVPGGRASSKI